MLKLGRVTKVKVLFLVLVFVFNFDLFKFSAAILEKGLFKKIVELVSKSAWLNGKASGHESKGKPKVCGSRLQR